MQHILTTHNFLTRGLTGLFDFILSVGKSIQFSRQCSANADLVQYFRIEYPNMSDHEILAELNSRTLEDFK